MKFIKDIENGTITFMKTYVAAREASLTVSKTFWPCKLCCRGSPYSPNFHAVWRVNNKAKYTNIMIMEA